MHGWYNIYITIIFIMNKTNLPQHIDTATTTDFETNQLAYINLNAPAAGTITVQNVVDGVATTFAVYAAATPAQSFLYNCVISGGILRVITAGASSVTVVL